MKNKTSTGHDEFNTTFIKLIINVNVNPLVHIFNSSLKEGIFPTKMKIARVIPLHKGGDTNALGNYRPISILPTFSKILEKIFASRLRNFF